MKKIAILTLILLCSTLSFAQDDESQKGFQKDKLFSGGSFGLSFGSYTFINVSPQLGYRFTKYVAAGMGLNMLYASQKVKDYYGNTYSKTSQGIAGLNLFGRFYPFEKFMIQVQPEGNYVFGNVRYFQPPGEGKYKLDAEIVPSLLLGGGLVMPTEKGAFLTTIMYDVLQRTNSPYGNRPIVNVGYNFNF